MKLHGLTGGMGMGKSTVAGFFSARGVPVIDTDEIARRLVVPGQPALAEIRQVFGADVLAEDGGLKRDELARRVFADAAARKRLEAILHPRIREDWLAQAGRLAAEGRALALVMIPLLFETQAEAHFDRTICVACSPAAQSARLAARGWSPEQSCQRLAAQWPVAQKMARADLVLWTEGALPASERQVERVLMRW